MIVGKKHLFKNIACVLINLLLYNICNEVASYFKSKKLINKYIEYISENIAQTIIIALFDRHSDI